MISTVEIIWVAQIWTCLLHSDFDSVGNIRCTPGIVSIDVDRQVEEVVLGHTPLDLQT